MTLYFLLLPIIFFLFFCILLFSYIYVFNMWYLLLKNSPNFTQKSLYFMPTDLILIVKIYPVPYIKSDRSNTSSSCYLSLISRGNSLFYRNTTYSINLILEWLNLIVNVDIDEMKFVSIYSHLTDLKFISCSKRWINKFLVIIIPGNNYCFCLFLISVSINWTY